jgi:hypothetical protein
MLAAICFAHNRDDQGRVKIMPDMFTTNVRELLALRKWTQKAPRQFSRATGMMLTNMAFEAKDEIGNWLDKNMTLRKPKFIRSSIRVQKSHTFPPIASQKSVVGSVQRPRFGGLEEQETGKKTARKRVATLAGRSGSRRKQIRGSYRLKRPLVNVSNFPARGGANSRVRAGLAVLDSKRKYAKPFIITGHSKLPPGVYRFFGGRNEKGQRKIQLLQGFDPPNRQPRRNKWMTMAIRQYMRRVNLTRMWIKIARRVVRQSLR